jgi:L-fuconolactonase
MQRRDFLRLASGSALSSLAPPKVGPAYSSDSTSSSLPPIVDSHIHLFDPTRPGGVPWPEKDDTALYKPALPDRYEALSAQFGIVGCIAVEASPLASDNDWLLGVAREHPVVLGVIGDLVPGTLTYLTELDRLHQNPLFLGVRYGNLWHRDLATDQTKPGFIAGLKGLSQAGLILESANPDPSLIRALLQTADSVGDLRIVVDHLPNASLPSQGADLEEYDKNLHALAQHPTVFVKLSEIPVVRDGKLIEEPAFYRDRVDTLWNLFGEDRVIFGSDWPNSDHIASFADTFGIVRQYMSQKPREAQEKYFWRNSARIYRWKPRRPNQPHL